MIPSFQLILIRVSNFWLAKHKEKPVILESYSRSHLVRGVHIASAPWLVLCLWHVHDLASAQIFWPKISIKSINERFICRLNWSETTNITRFWYHRRSIYRDANSLTQESYGPTAITINTIIFYLKLPIRHFNYAIAYNAVSHRWYVLWRRKNLYVGFNAAILSGVSRNSSKEW